MLAPKNSSWWWCGTSADEEERWTGNPQLTNDDKQVGKKKLLTIIIGLL